MSQNKNTLPWFRKPLFYPLNYGGEIETLVFKVLNYNPEVALKSANPGTLERALASFIKLNLP